MHVWAGACNGSLATLEPRLKILLCKFTAAVKCLHPNICIAVRCSIPLHPQLPWYHESAHHWGLRVQI